MIPLEYRLLGDDGCFVSSHHEQLLTACPGPVARTMELYERLQTALQRRSRWVGCPLAGVDLYGTRREGRSGPHAGYIRPGPATERPPSQEIKAFHQQILVQSENCIKLYQEAPNHVLNFVLELERNPVECFVHIREHCYYMIL